MPENHIHVEPPRMLVIAATGTLAILALFLFAEIISVVQGYGYPANPIQDTITVSGTGTATSSPDIADISFTVQQSASSVTAAQSAATSKGNAAIAAMKALGIADADITTSSYNVYPQYAQAVVNPCPPGVMCPATVTNSNTITGYQVSESVDVKVRDVTSIGTVLQKLGDLGVQNISGPNYGQADNSATKDAARAAAIKDAQQKAAVLASQLGVHLGKVTSFSENGNSPYPMVYGAMASAKSDAAAPELPTGTNTTSATVSITYAIR